MSLTLTKIIIDVLPIGTPSLAATAAGGIVVQFRARVNVEAREGVESGAVVHAEFQALPSSVRLHDALLGVTLPGRLQSVLIGKGPTAANLDFVLPLCREDIVALENLRAGHAAEFKTSFLFSVRVDEGGTYEQPLEYRVAASDWIDLLASVGLFKTVTISLPLSDQTDPTTNNHIRNELNRATRLFRGGDYSGSVAVVRDAWDSILKEFDPSGKWDALLKNALPQEIFEVMSKYAEALRTIVNKGHHRSLTAPSGELALYEFTVADAEFVLQASLTFLRYLGRLPRPIANRQSS